MLLRHANTHLSRSFGLQGRRISTTSIAYRTKPSTSNSTSASAASQPVSLRNAPPPPPPPTRPIRSSSTPRSTSASSPFTPPTSPKRSGGKEGSVYASYKALPYNTKLIFWTCGAMIAALGLLAADKLEELFPARNNKSISISSPSPQKESGEAKYISYPDQESEKTKPKLFSISVVDRK